MTTVPEHTSGRQLVRDCELRRGRRCDAIVVVDVRASHHPKRPRSMESARATSGTLSIIFPLIYVVLALPCGLLLDRWFRPFLLLGGLLTAGGALLRIIDTASIEWATIGQVVIAVGQPLVLGAITKVCVDYLPHRNRATGIAAGTAGLFVGMLIAFITGALLEDDISTLLIIRPCLRSSSSSRWPWHCRGQDDSPMTLTSSRASASNPLNDTHCARSGPTRSCGC